MREIVSKQVEKVLKGILDHEERYWSQGTYIRWGKVQDDLVENIMSVFCKEKKRMYQNHNRRWRDE